MKNTNNGITNSEYIREVLKIPNDISDDQIANSWFGIYYGVDEYPELADVLSYLGEERKIER